MTFKRPGRNHLHTGKAVDDRTICKPKSEQKGNAWTMQKRHIVLTGQAQGLKNCCQAHFILRFQTQNPNCSTLDKCIVIRPYGILKYHAHLMTKLPDLFFGDQNKLLFTAPHHATTDEMNDAPAMRRVGRSSFPLLQCSRFLSLLNARHSQERFNLFGKASVIGGNDPPRLCRGITTPGSRHQKQRCNRCHYLVRFARSTLVLS